MTWAVLSSLGSIYLSIGTIVALVSSISAHFSRSEEDVELWRMAPVMYVVTEFVLFCWVTVAWPFYLLTRG